MTKKYVFRNWQCGELCANNEIELELSGDNSELISEMELNGWLLFEKKVPYENQKEFVLTKDT